MADREPAGGVFPGVAPGPSLRAKAAALPPRPGVYLFKDDRGGVLYVGKARSLRHRVAQYFQVRPDRDPKTAALMKRAVDVEGVELDSEVDALLAECRLIKDLQPRYNVNLKDGKSYPFLAITTGEDFPKVYVTRERFPGRAVYFGPFPDAGGLHRAVALLQRVFRFRTCDLAIVEGDPKNRHFRPCILHSIGQCTAPCADRIGKTAYREDIRALRRILAGRRGDLVRDLRRRMDEASGSLAFEDAARYRDQIRALASLDERARFGVFVPGGEGPVTPIDPRAALAGLRRLLDLPAAPRTIEGIDISTLQGGDSVGSLVSFVDGVPFKDGYRRYRIRGSDSMSGPRHPPSLSGSFGGTSGVAPPARVAGERGRRTGDRGRGTGNPPDDYAMIREVTLRRFARLDAEGAPFPDVFLVDGGVGQLRAAAEAIGELKIAPAPVILALAKREETVYRWGRAGPVPAARRDLGLRLLMAVRDEAHRFAGHYHRILRRKRTIGR